MNIATVTDAVTRIGGRQLLKVQKHSPELLVGAGIIGVVATGVLLVRSTRKAEPEIERFKQGLDQMEIGRAVAKDPESNYTPAEFKKDTIYFVRTSTTEFVKLYGLPIALGTASIVSILAGHKILQGRYVAVAAAYQGLQFTFDEYRKRVATQIGEEKELDLFRGAYKEVTVNEETGKKKTETKYSRHGMSQYAKFFDEFNKNYVPGRPDQNKHFLLAQEKYLTERLRSRGHLFLNEVYEAIGMDPTPAGQIVGWIYGSENGDGYVSFGIDDPSNEMARMFVNGLEDAVLLDFNVDGEMWSLI